MNTVIATAYGGTEVLEVQEVPVPEPAANEVQIKVHASGINYADIMQRHGLYPGGPKAPFGLGFEVSGVVEKVGDGIKQWKVGDEVMSEFTVRGTFDEVADRMRDKYEGLVDRVGFYIPVIGGAHEKQWGQVVKAIVG